MKLYRFPDEKSGGVSYEKVRDEIEKDLEITDITATDLQGNITGPTIILDEYRNQVTERMKDDKNLNILAIYIDLYFKNLKVFSEQKLI